MDYLGFINKELILFIIVYVPAVLVLNYIWKHPKGLAPFKEWIIEQWETCKDWITEKFWECWAKRLRIIYLIIASVILYHLLEIFIHLRDQIFLDIAGLEGSELRNLAIAFLGTVTGIGALFGVYLAILRSETTERQTRANEEGLITDRINRATEGLGKNNENSLPVIEVRLGALYALERIAQDSIRDHVQIVEILCAYVRTNSPLENKMNRIKEPPVDKISNEEYKTNKLRKRLIFDKMDKSVELYKLREDIQAALAIIGRRDTWPNGKKNMQQENKQGYQLDLRDCDLRLAQLSQTELSGGHFYFTDMSGAQLFNSNLMKTYFDEANMSDAFLDKANLSGAWFNLADLTNAQFQDANLSDVWFDHAILNRTDFNRAITYQAAAHMADFSKCINLTQEQIDQMFCGKNVKIPKGLKRPKHWPTDYLSYADFMALYFLWRRWRKTLNHPPNKILNKKNRKIYD